MHGKHLLHRKVGKHITETKKTLVLWVSRGRSKPWSGLEVSTTCRLGAWGLVATFAGVGLAVAVLAGGGGGGALDTTGAEVGTFWEGAEGLVEGGTLPLPLLFLLVTVVKGASSTAVWSTAISVSRDGSWGKLEP